MTNFTKFPKKKKKKKKRGGGKVYSRSGRDFQCLCSFKLTSGIVIKLLLLLLLLFFSAAITTTVRDISFPNLTTSFRMTPNRKPPGPRKKLCMITELCPCTQKTLSTEQARTITDIRNLIGGISRGTNNDVLSTKKVSRKVLRITRFRPTFRNIL